MKNLIFISITLLFFACQNKEKSSVKTDRVIQSNNDFDNNNKCSLFS